MKKRGDRLAGRKNRYQTHVQPHLEDISDWIQTYNEDQIAAMLGISMRSFQNYKNDYPELRDALKNGRMDLAVKLKKTLKQKALGYNYKEKKTTTRKDSKGNTVKVTEEFERYAQPDLGSIHLLLKNIDPNWHNDDQETIRQKRKQLEQTDRRIDNQEW
jgi:hypothetical protein